MRVVLGVLEGQRIEMVEKVHILHVDMIRYLDSGRSEIKNAGDASVHHMLRRALGPLGGGS